MSIQWLMMNLHCFIAQQRVRGSNRHDAGQPA
jgi:hypothetical protein